MAKQILLIGIGQLGCAVAERFWNAASSDMKDRVLAIDTDARITEKICGPSVISLAETCLLGDVLDELDNDVIKNWFPCDKEKDYVEFFECLSMNEGANQWRMKALLSFAHFLSKPGGALLLHHKLDEIVESFDGNDGQPEVDIHVVASLAGGTGSGLFLPVALYIKRYLKERGIKVEAQALLALPDICEQLMTSEQRIKAQANAYAAIREINAMNLVADGASPETAPRIGNENDPYFGVLYDPTAAQSGGMDAIPFKQIYLFRRNPGIRSLSLHLDFITDAATYLCAQKTILTPNTPDAVFSGLNISKSKYPVESIVSYISLATIHKTASEQLTFLYDKVSKELAVQKAQAENPADPIPDNPAHNIARAVMAVNKSIRKEEQSDSVFLNRQYDDPANDNAPESRYPDCYPTYLLSYISSELINNNQDATYLDEVIAAEKIRADKEQKPTLFNKIPSSARKNEMLAVANQANNHLRDLYKQCATLLNAGTAPLEAVLFGDDPSLSITETIFKDNGKFINPIFALVRLCDLYLNIYDALTDVRFRNKDNYKKITSFELPEWIITADDELSILCPYDTGKTRFSDILKDSHPGIKGRRDEERLFYYDLKLSYARIKDAYLAARSQQLLDVLGKQIIFYFELLDNISDDIDELATDTGAALQACTPDCSHFYYYVGASEYEKKQALAAYRDYLEQKDLVYKYEAEFDTALGEAAIHRNPMIAKSNFEADRPTYDLLPLVKEQCYSSGFFAEKLDRNILDVIMSLPGREDADSVSLALSKALSTRALPLLYVIPNSRKNFPEALLVKKVSTALFPKVSEQFIADNPGLFGNTCGIKALNELLFGIDQYETEPTFSPTLSDKEINICHTVCNLKPAYLEAFNEYSEAPIYYKSYLKALRMHEQQMTELWNPHLIRSLSVSNTLSPIYSKPSDPEPSDYEEF